MCISFLLVLYSLLSLAFKNPVIFLLRKFPRNSCGFLSSSSKLVTSPLVAQFELLLSLTSFEIFFYYWVYLSDLSLPCTPIGLNFSCHCLESLDLVFPAIDLLFFIFLFCFWGSVPFDHYDIYLTSLCLALIISNVWLARLATANDISFWSFPKLLITDLFCIMR